MERSTLDQVVQEVGPTPGSPLGILNHASAEAQENPPPETPDNPAEDLDKKMEAMSGQSEVSARLTVFNFHW